MKFGIYRPAQAARGPVPGLMFLAGLTCNEETFAIKAGAQRFAASRGLMLITPDTSPRQTGVPGADADWEFGEGAGFYLDAIQPPWKNHWQMASYVVSELPDLIETCFPLKRSRLGISGHSMGGHGALTLGLKHPGVFSSVSAIAPIASPMRCPWGTKAFERYLGPNEGTDWACHDAVELIRTGARLQSLRVDQGMADPYMSNQLHPELLESVCQDMNHPLNLQRHEGADHSYYFVASVISDHVDHHADILYR